MLWNANPAWGSYMTKGCDLNEPFNEIVLTKSDNFSERRLRRSADSGRGGYTRTTDSHPTTCHRDARTQRH